MLFQQLNWQIYCAMAQANNPPLIDGLIRADSRKLFVDGLETIYDYWVPLLRRTTLPREVTSTDPRVAVVFRDLGQLVASPDVVIARLASIQLTRLMHSLKEKIKVDRQNGRIFPMKRTDSVAVDMYLYSLGRHHDQVARRQAVRQLRMSKRWADLAKESPLLIITHSEKATKLVYVAPLR